MGLITRPIHPVGFFFLKKKFNNFLLIFLFGFFLKKKGI